MAIAQLGLFATHGRTTPCGQLLKWIGNKQRFAAEIVRFFPETFGCYFEPFIGSGAVLATLAPSDAIGSDTFAPLIEIWRALREQPRILKGWYEERYECFIAGEKSAQYEKLKASYNTNPNGPDLLFLCRTCYGGVMRFRKADGYMSTPCGIHQPIKPESFARRVDEWHARTEGAHFQLEDYTTVMARAKEGDLIYCDPPYTHSQTILYGAQTFSLKKLFEVIERCKSRGVFVAVSIDGTKKSGDMRCALPIPAGLFEREVLIDCGRSMLKRFQMNGKSLETEYVSDRLLLTY